MSGLMDGINAAFNNETVRRVLLMLRKPLGGLLALGVAALTRPEWFWPGLAVSAFGALMQLWCFSCIKTSKELAANGPYKFVRNPMYLSRFFLMLGFLMFLGQPWVLPVFAVVYYFYMANRVRREERKLSGIFGAPYEEYCRRVNRFVPSWRVWPQGRVLYASRECFMRNNGVWNILTVALFWAVCYGFAFHI